jgi:hypothetical protein
MMKVAMMAMIVRKTDWAASNTPSIERSSAVLLHDPKRLIQMTIGEAEDEIVIDVHAE